MLARQPGLPRFSDEPHLHEKGVAVKVVLKQKWMFAEEVAPPSSLIGNAIKNNFQVLGNYNSSSMIIPLWKVKIQRCLYRQECVGHSDQARMSRALEQNAPLIELFPQTRLKESCKSICYLGEVSWMWMCWFFSLASVYLPGRIGKEWMLAEVDAEGPRARPRSLSRMSVPCIFGSTHQPVSWQNRKWRFEYEKLLSGRWDL